MDPPVKDDICVLADQRIVLCEGVVCTSEDKREYVISQLLKGKLANGTEFYKACPVPQWLFASVAAEYVFDHGPDILTKDGYWTKLSQN